MSNTVRLFMKRPTTWVGIATAFMFQLIFSVVWMTGYDGVMTRTNQLHIGIVNEDNQFGTAIVKQLQTALPFKTEVIADNDSAQRKLNERELQMVIRIPATFSSETAKTGSKAALEYTMNESNPALIKSIMSSVSANVTASVNKVVVGNGIQQVLTQAKLPPEQAAAVSESLSERVVSNVKSINAVDGMSNQMVPMMMVLASFVGSMIMGMNMEQASIALAAQAGRRQRFLARAVINVVAAVMISLVGSALIMALGGQAEHGFLGMWGILCLILVTFMFVTQMFLLIFGMAGMLFNILLLSLQLVTSGAMVPRELLSDFYLGLGNVLPATYAVEGAMDVLFGGASIGSAVLALLIIAVAAFVIGAVTVGLKRGVPAGNLGVSQSAH